HLGTPQVIAPLARLARAQPNAEVRDEAVEQYAGAPPQSPRSSCWWTDSRTTARPTSRWRPSSAWRTSPTGSGSRRCGRRPAPTRAATCGPKRDAAWKTTARASRGRSRGQPHRSVRPEEVERIDGDRPIGAEPVEVRFGHAPGGTHAADRLAGVDRVTRHDEHAAQVK